MSDIQIKSYRSTTDENGNVVIVGSDGQTYSPDEFAKVFNISEVWSSLSCMGYAVLGMEYLKYEPEKIQAVVSALDADFCGDKFFGSWDNHHCITYIEQALKKRGYSAEDIEGIIKGVIWEFDGYTVEEAADYFKKSYPAISAFYG